MSPLCSSPLLTVPSATVSHHALKHEHNSTKPLAQPNHQLAVSYHLLDIRLPCGHGGYHRWLCQFAVLQAESHRPDSPCNGLQCRSMPSLSAAAAMLHLPLLQVQFHSQLIRCTAVVGVKSYSSTIGGLLINPVSDIRTLQMTACMRIGCSSLNTMMNQTRLRPEMPLTTAQTFFIACCPAGTGAARTAQSHLQGVVITPHAHQPPAPQTPACSMIPPDQPSR